MNIRRRLECLIWMGQDQDGVVHKIKEYADDLGLLDSKKNQIKTSFRGGLFANQ